MPSSFNPFIIRIQVFQLHVQDVKSHILRESYQLILVVGGVLVKAFTLHDFRHSVIGLNSDSDKCKHTNNLPGSEYFIW